MTRIRINERVTASGVDRFFSAATGGERMSKGRKPHIATTTHIGERADGGGWGKRLAILPGEGMDSWAIFFRGELIRVE